MIKVITEDNKFIMPFDLKKPGRQTEEFITTKVGNVSGHDYQKFEKGKDSKIVYMTADEYIDECIHEIFDSTYEATVTNAVDFDKVNEYAEAMKNGAIFPIPYLNYISNNQEGRHRMLAFKKINGPNAKAPVLTIFPADPSNEEIMDYCKRRWEDYWKSFYDSMKHSDNSEDDEELEVSSEDEEELLDDLQEIDPDADEEDLDTTMEYLADKSGYSVEELWNNAELFMRVLTKYL